MDKTKLTIPFVLFYPVRKRKINYKILYIIKLTGKICHYCVSMNKRNFHYLNTKPTIKSIEPILEVTQNQNKYTVDVLVNLEYSMFKNLSE